MPRYDYHCPDNGQTFEVKHNMGQALQTWGEVRAALGIDADETPDEAPVHRLLHAAGVMGTLSRATVSAQGADAAPAPAPAAHSCCSGGSCSHKH